MKTMILFNIFFSQMVLAMPPTSQHGPSLPLVPQRDISSRVEPFNDKAKSASQAEFVRIDEDLGIIMRLDSFPIEGKEWKVYASGFPIVSTRARRTCERNYAKAIRSRMQNVLAAADKINLKGLDKFNNDTSLKAWVSVDKAALNSAVNLKFIKECWSKGRAVSGE